MPDPLFPRDGVRQARGGERQGGDALTCCPGAVNLLRGPSRVALAGMAHSFIELDKAVIHVISLVSFL